MKHLDKNPKNRTETYLKNAAVHREQQMKYRKREQVALAITSLGLAGVLYGDMSNNEPVSMVGSTTAVVGAAAALAFGVREVHAAAKARHAEQDASTAPYWDRVDPLPGTLPDSTGTTEYTLPLAEKPARPDDAK